MGDMSPLWQYRPLSCIMGQAGGLKLLLSRESAAVHVWEGAGAAIVPSPRFGIRATGAAGTRESSVNPVGTPQWRCVLQNPCAGYAQDRDLSDRRGAGTSGLLRALGELNRGGKAKIPRLPIGFF